MKDVSPKSCLIAFAAFTLAGVLLAGTYVSYLVFVTSGTGPARLLSGNDFRAVVGRLRADGDAASITGHRQANNYRRAIISRWGLLNADEYRYLSVSVSPGHPALEVKLFWRSADDPDELHSRAFPGGSLHENWLDMHNTPNWQGKISELGLVLETRTEAFPLAFTGINLAPYQPGPALGNIISEWTANRGFDQTTINRLSATYSGAALSPVMAIAAWIGVALLILVITRRYAPHIPKSTFLLLVLPGWVFLDLLWQRQLSQQWELSRHLFAGMSIEARHLRDVDSEFYEHAMQIKRDVLPTSPVRLFIVHNSESHNYQRLKMQYYLLPHNTYNIGLFPPGNHPTPGDYLLVLGEIPGLTIDPATATVTWRDEPPWSASLKHTHDLGRLYRITARASAVLPRGNGAFSE